MSSYELVKAIHFTSVHISLAGFITRGIWMMQSAPMLQLRWVKIGPHINDSILLLSAVALVYMTSQYPGMSIWINAKIVALLAYIVLGSIALKYGKTMRVRIIAWCLALAVFVYILMVAYSKSACPF